MVAIDLDTSMTSGSVGIMSRAEEVPSALVRSFARSVVEVSRSDRPGTNRSDEP